jgi:ADP-ribose pyrophosphatase YjhB (NUDIX family)
MTRIETLAIIHQPPKILLWMKKKNFGTGKYNGFGGGGGVEAEESLEKSVIRETLEEANIKIINPELVGKILFQFQTKEQDHLVYFFKVKEYLGVPKESEEMTVTWFNENYIPYEKMLEDDKYWLPMLLTSKKFIGNFIFNKDFKISKYKLKEVEELN